MSDDGKVLVMPPVPEAIELRHLRAFVAVAEDLNFSRAFDLRQVAALELVPQSGAGQAWLIDEHGSNKGVPDPRPVALPRVDVGALTVQEGDSGSRTYQVPVTLTGNSPGTVRLFINENGTNYTERLVTLEPGHQTVEIPMQVVTIPTVTDTEAEPAERVRLRMGSWPPGGREFELVGTVTDAP
jgi:hypothetical protein